MNDIHKNTEEYNPNKKRKILIVIDGVIVDMLGNKKGNPIVTKIGRKLSISPVFITQFYFAVLKHIRINSTLYFLWKFQKKRELQQIAYNHSSDNDFKDFMKLYKKCTAKPYSFLVVDTTLAWDSNY